MEIKQDLIKENVLDISPPPFAFLKIERHHPSCQQAPQPWANEENRAALDVLMDGASPSTLVSLAA